MCAAIFSGKIGHSERSEESRPRREENEILRCDQNDGVAYLPENMAAHASMKRLTVGLAIFFIFALTHGHAAENNQKAKPAASNLPAGVQCLKDLPYVADGHERQRLDLYLPEKIDHPLPVVVWVHGGAWMAGSKEGCPAVWLVSKGYAVASINYRLSQHAVFPAQIQDCKAAIRWLRANAEKYKLDGKHVGVWGASAGGHLVSLLGTTGGVREFEGDGGNAEQSSRVQAVVDWFGPSDFVALGAHEKKATEPLSTLLGGLVKENAAKARWASPLSYVAKDAAPFLIMQGDKDEIVAPSHSSRLAEALKAAGVEVQLDMLPGSGHGGPAFDTPEKLKLIEDFFAKHLKANGRALATTDPH